MSQLNMQQILSGDNLSTVVEKLNYNFNQIVLNGGGPQGLRGIIGAPGLPGVQGIQGPTGPVGEEGTHIYADGASPSNYPFGTGGEILPRTGDIFVETDPTYLNVYQYAVTGGTGNYWNLVETIQAPGSALSKLVFDQVQGLSASWTNVSNDPAIAGKMLFGSPDSLYGTYVIDPANPINSSTPKLRTELSSVVPFGDSLVTYASDRNQLRLLDYTRTDATRLQKGGGVVHSVETISTNQTYRIVNGDINGENHFTLSLNNGVGISPTLLYADTTNKLGIGVSEFTPLIANATVNGSLAVGSLATSFYLASAGATLSGGIGAIIEGNVAIGRNSNTTANLGVFNQPGSFGSVMKIDTDQSAASTSAVADLFFGGGMYGNYLNPSTPSNYWRFRHDSYSSPGNPDYRKFTLFGAQQGITGSASGVAYRTVLTAGLTASSTSVASQVSIDATELFDKFEVGELPENRISIGNQQGGALSGYMNMHLGFNLSRSPISDSWRRMSDGANNAGRAFWSSPYTGLGLSLFPSTGTSNVTGITDAQVYDNTRLYIGTTGKLSLSETRNAATLTNVPLSVDFGATGTTGQGYDSNYWRRFVAAFGEGLQTGVRGTPMIATTNGVTQSISTGIPVYGGTASVLPHFTWAGDDRYGLYLSQGSTANGGQGSAVGLSVDGTAVVTAVGSVVSENRVGILQENPLERLHIGTKLMYHDGGSKFLGYNVYYDQIAGVLRRAYGSTASGATQEGAFGIRYLENNRADGTLGLNRYTNLGTKLSLVPYNAGGTSTSLPNDGSALVHRSLTISPPAVGPTSAGWTNAAPFVPQVSIGLNTSDFAAEQDSPTSLKRGTLSLAAQLRIKPATAASPPTGPFGITIEDQYNLGLYSYDGFPVSAIYTNGGNSLSTTKSFGINFITSGGNAIAGDIPFLAATTDKNLTLPYQRIANFGSGFRLGINIVPQTQPTVYTTAGDPIFNYASLVVGAYVEGLPGNYEQAIISKGILTIDQSTYSNGGGGNQGLVFKDNSILAYGATGRPSVSEYYGDWAIQYCKFDPNEAGLNLWKPFGSLGAGVGNGVLYLSDNGQVSMGFDPPTGVWSSGGTYTTNGIRFAVNGGGKFTGDSYFSDRMIIDNVSNQTTSVVGPFTTAVSSVQIKFGTTYRRLTSLTATGSITSLSGPLGFIYSDIRLKKNVTPLGKVSEAFSKLNFVSFEWNDKMKKKVSDESNIVDPRTHANSTEEDYRNYLEAKKQEEDSLSGNRLGVIAQEIAEVFPDVVKGGENDSNLVIDFDRLSVYTMKTVQELCTIIEEKDETIKNLENRLSKIEELLAKNNIK